MADAHSTRSPITATGFNQRLNVTEAATAAAKALRRGQIDTPELDARVLLCHAAGVTHEDYVANPNLPLSPEAATRFAADIVCRLKGEPVSRIIGYREFYGREFRIDQDTLDPRPDTETLIEAALAIADRQGWRRRPIDILDLGTGSGAILLTLLAELPHARGVGADLSLGALDVARANAEELGVAARASFIAANWLDGIAGSFDLVVSNPPYIASGAIAELAPEVRLHDPKLALDGGADGLAAYRAIAASAPLVLRPGGSLLIEIGPDQADAVLALFKQCGLYVNASDGIWRDLAGRARVVVGNA
jgi:release factor glutamine methyltransferase